MMKSVDIPQFRLQNTGLSISPFQHPDEVAEQLGAVQAQDFTAAKWSIALLILLRPEVKQCTCLA